jgi:hypothetical protein
VKFNAEKIHLIANVSAGFHGKRTVLADGCLRNSALVIHNFLKNSMEMKAVYCLQAGTPVDWTKAGYFVPPLLLPLPVLQTFGPGLPLCVRRAVFQGFRRSLPGN